MIVTHRYITEGLYIPENATGLIVGTFPSVLIRQALNNLRACDVNFYYGSCDNFFWTDLERIYNKRFQYDWTNESVKQRKASLNELQLAITDIVLECETDGGTTDNALVNCVINEFLINVLDNNPNIKTLFFTSGTGKINADRLTLKLLRERRRIYKRSITQRQNPKIRTFIFRSANGLKREMKSVTLYSPSPVAKRGGVTDDKRRIQYETYLPKINPQR
ncbi:MAG: hypothetical protein ACTHK8_12170 [Ginsengibacter sp.]